MKKIKKIKNEKMINVDEEPTKNIKMKNIIKKNFSKRKMNSNTIIFENVYIKNLNARTFMMFYINDLTSFASIFILKFLLEFEKFLKIKNKTLTKAQTKKESSKKNLKK